MTAKLDIDFANRSGTTLWGACLLLAGVVAAIVLWQQHQESAAEVADWEQAIARIGRDTAAPAPMPDNATLQQIDRAHVQQVLKQLNLPWSALFEVLEKTAGGDVSLLSLKPDPVRETVRIDGAAASLHAMLAYARRLQDARYFAKVELVEHEIDPKGGKHPVQFRIEARWQP